ncbi:MAG: hypothetical protein HUK02_00355 [Bacteroidaceae bacterium]|nr:hypothetical protein [Bacteroidaceae bacterium]
MKKVFLFAMAAVAMSFAACGNKTAENAAGVDSIDTVAVIDEVVDPIDALTEVVNGDLTKAPELIESAKAKVQELIAAGNLDEAKKYALKLQEWAESNKEKLENANINVANIVDLVKGVPGATEDAAKAGVDAAKADAQSVAEGVENAVKDAAKDAKAAAEQKVAEETAKAQKAATDAANKAIDDAAAKAKKGLGL